MLVSSFIRLVLRRKQTAQPNTIVANTPYKLVLDASLRRRPLDCQRFSRWQSSGTEKKVAGGTQKGLFVVVAEDIAAPQIGAAMSSATTTNGRKQSGRWYPKRYHLPLCFLYHLPLFFRRSTSAVDHSTASAKSAGSRMVQKKKLSRSPKKVCLWWSRKKSCTGHPKR